MLSLTALLCSLAIVAAGCGGDDNSSSSSSSSDTSTTKQSSSGGGGGATAQTLKLSADPGGALKFDKSSLTAKAGKVTITLDNPSSLPHAVEIEGNGVEQSSDTIGKGQTTKVTATVKPGKYEFYCPVDGHRAGGMEGTLTVQ
ncbi:MAG TPA: plastocyanin/azurin family copper-binding protein [Thermoleophilaceae bacterium]|nr:plastocyanin/azurin family copper-binding protein [Thermoleophilaceae bacterium]